MTEMVPEESAPASSKPNTPTPAPAPAAEEAPAPAEATARLVLVPPDSITESFTAFVADYGQFRIDAHGVDVPADATEAIIENAEAHGFVVKEA